MAPNCVVHELEYEMDKANYFETWQCKNCPYAESHYLECL